MKRSCVLVATSIAVAVSSFAARPLALVGADDELPVMVRGRGELAKIQLSRSAPSLRRSCSAKEAT